MHKAASEADNMLNVLRDTEAELAALGTQEPQGWATLSYDEKLQYLDNMKSALQGTQQIANELQDANQQKSDMLGNLKDMGVDQAQQPVQAKRRVFNLKRAQMEMAQEGVQPAVPQTDAAMPPDEQSPTGKVRQLLDGIVAQLQQDKGLDEQQAQQEATNVAYTQITSNLTNPNQTTTDPTTNAQGNSEQTVRDSVNTYYSSADENEKDACAAVLARTIFPQDTQDASVDNGEVPVVQEDAKVNVAKFVSKTNDIIMRLAQKHASKATKSVFNLSKVAHVRNVVVFDPETAVKDEATGMAMSANDLLERNKGYGIKLTDHYSLNWEKVWRENVMDKYDPLYLERRFEVDKNIPPANNMQLAPGEKRRITPPEYGNTEARLEANRTEMNKERGYKPSEPGEPFNWKKAQSSKKKVEANGVGADMNPMKPAELNTPTFLCPFCRNQLADDGLGQPKSEAGNGQVQCSQCKGVFPQQQVIKGPPKLGPDAAKTTSVPGTQSVPVMGSANTEVEKLADAHGGIFFDSENLKFVVVAGKKKKKFDTYYEAEEFKMLVQDPSAVPGAKAPTKQRTPSKLTPEQAERQRQIALHADGLCIDG